MRCCAHRIKVGVFFLFAAKLDRRFRTDPCHGYIFAYLIKWLSRNLVDSLFWFPGARGELPPATLRRAKIGSGYPKATFAVNFRRILIQKKTSPHSRIINTNAKINRVQEGSNSNICSGRIWQEIPLHDEKRRRS